MLVQAKGLSKTFTRGNLSETVLRDVSLDVPRGEFLALLGPSGSGKSTLLHLLGAMDSPSTGEISFSGRRIDQDDESALDTFRRKELGFIFQTFNLMSLLTAEENVSLSLLGRGVSRQERKDLSRQALAQVGMLEHSSKLPRQMSGGQRQRVAIARAFVHEPSLILADEPTANLDHSSVARVMDLLCELQTERKTTVIVATHDLDVSRRAHRVLKIEGGRIV